MEESQLKNIAKQLRRPEGDDGLKVASVMNSGNELINRWSIEALDIQRGDRILELGMGNGYFVKEILSVQPDVKYTGLDISSLMVEQSLHLNQRFIDQGQADFILRTPGPVPFSDDEFNKIFTINTLYFWEEPIHELKELKRVLTDDGILIISIRPKEVMKNYPFTKYGFNMYSESEVVELLEKNSFQVISILRRQEPDQKIGEITFPVSSLIFTAKPVKL